MSSSSTTRSSPRASSASRLQSARTTRWRGFPTTRRTPTSGSSSPRERRSRSATRTSRPRPGKLVRRKLTRILSPGTTLAANQLEAARNRYLCAVSLDKDGLHAAWIELSTGEFRVATAPRIGDLLPVLASLDPAELLVAEGEVERWRVAPHDQAPGPRAPRLRLRPDAHGAPPLPIRGGGGRAHRRRGDRRPEPAGIRPRKRPPGPRAGGRPCGLRDRQPLREAREPAQPEGVPELADAPPRPGHPAQPGDLLLGARRPPGIAPCGDGRHGDVRGRPPPRALARGPGPRSRRDPQAPRARRRTLGAARAPRRAHRGTGRASATSRASSGASRTGCATRASSAASGTRSGACPQIRAALGGLGPRSRPPCAGASTSSRGSATSWLRRPRRRAAGGRGRGELRPGGPRRRARPRCARS